MRKKIKYIILVGISLFVLFSCDLFGPSTSSIKNKLPGISIYITDGKVDEFLLYKEKKKEFAALMTIDGKEDYDNFESNIVIRGRGNSSWKFAKKPYRIELEEKTSLFGLPAYTKWILLAEYLDGSLLYNSIPYTMGKQLGMPFTNTIIPVELSINGTLQGVYAFTEHKEVGEGRIDLASDGLLLELDAYYDEDWKFKSSKYDLPVMIQYPKSKDMDNSMLTAIQEDFETFEALVFDANFPNTNYLDYLDEDSFINYHYCPR